MGAGILALGEIHFAMQQFVGTFASPGHHATVRTTSKAPAGKRQELFLPRPVAERREVPVWANRKNKAPPLNPSPFSPEPSAIVDRAPTGAVWSRAGAGGG